MVFVISRLLLCFFVSVLVSTSLVRLCFRSIRKHDNPNGKPFVVPISGFWIGLFETILVFVFVIERQYVALAIVVAAKHFFGGRAGMSEDRRAGYDLASLINVSVAVIFALIARSWISHALWVYMV